MCGIFAVVNDQTNQAAQTVLVGLKKLEYRGYDSWGIALKNDGLSELQIEKHIGKIGDAKTALPKGRLAIGHTRWATHGGVTDANAHPHSDCLGRLAVIHNGIVENYLEFKTDLQKKGHTFLSETDTEVISHLIEEKIKNTELENAVFETFKSLAGSNAIGVIDYKTEKIVACRNGSPLVIGIDEKNSQYFLGSDVPAFLKFTNKVYFLEDGDAVVMDKSGIKLYEISSGREKTFKFQTLDWKLEDAEKSGFPHFLLKEINEEKKTIAKIASINKNELFEIAGLIKSGFNLTMLGCGSASYCALAGKYFLAEAGINSQVYSANEYQPFSGFSNEKSIVMAISQSGETADTIIAAKKAKKNGAKLVAVVNARGSTLERMADVVIPVGAGPEIAVVSTKGFTSQLATLYLLSKIAENKYEEGKNNLKKFGNVLSEWLNEKLESEIIDLAKTLIDQEHIYVIGKHLNYPGAMEFALKIKETAYIHGEPFAAGELKHGVITLIQKGTPCFVLSNNDEVKNEVLSSAAELKARGGRIIGVAPYQSAEFDEVILTPDTGDLTVFANIIVGQLLGYYLGVGRGTDPDKPRNLAKSVTVK